jgi:hypothetical protein
MFDLHHETINQTQISSRDAQNGGNGFLISEIVEVGRYPMTPALMKKKRLCCKNDDEGGDDVKSSSRSVRLPLQTTWQPRQPGLAHLLCSPLAVVLF